MMKHIHSALLLAALASSLIGIDVGGHINEDTVWSPEHNPYNVTSFLYIGQQATLTILPGTEVRILGANKNYPSNFRWSGSYQPWGKMIVVRGKIEAIGTAEQPITFDRMQDDSNYLWGGIFIVDSAPVSSFKYCEFRHAYFCDYAPGIESKGAIEFDNGIINVRSCVFENNLAALISKNLQSDILVYDCKFISFEDTYTPAYMGASFMGFRLAHDYVPEQNYQVTVAKCYFAGNASPGGGGYYTDNLSINNHYNNIHGYREERSDIRSEVGTSSCYGNVIVNGVGGMWSYADDADDVAFARRNVLYRDNSSEAILTLSSSGYGTNYISDNLAYGRIQVSIKQRPSATTHFNNNIIESYIGQPFVIEPWVYDDSSSQVYIYNNLVSYIGSATSSRIAKVKDISPLLFNNSFIGFYDLGTFDVSHSPVMFESVFTNNILDLSRGMAESNVSGAGILLNNCLTNPILENPQFSYVDNMIADPCFVDTLSGDYSLQASSPCIDAGLNLPELPAFDLRYHNRIAPGGDDGSQTVDIGAYEYGSQYIGGILGNVYDALTGEAVDCVKLEILQKLPEFSDTLGCFYYPTGVGMYEIKASRWDYSDRYIRNVTVVEGINTIVNIALTPLSVSNEDELDPPDNLLPDLWNYPNPFNPQTTISFILPETQPVTLGIYNLKGQKVSELFDGTLNAGNHNFVWNGTDSNGRAVSSGIYFTRIESGKQKRIHKLMLMK